MYPQNLPAQFIIPPIDHLYPSSDCLHLKSSLLRLCAFQISRLLLLLLYCYGKKIIPYHGESGDDDDVTESIMCVHYVRFRLQ